MRQEIVVRRSESVAAKEGVRLAEPELRRSVRDAGPARASAAIVVAAAAAAAKGDPCAADANAPRPRPAATAKNDASGDWGTLWAKLIAETPLAARIETDVG